MKKEELRKKQEELKRGEPGFVGENCAEREY